MSISSPELWKRIAQEGIASPLQCRTWAAEAAKSMPSQDAADGLKMAVQLIDLGYLTKYQAKTLVGQADQPLRLGRFHIRQQLKSPVWGQWIEVAEVDLARPKQTANSWAFRLPASQIPTIEARRPSLKRAIAISHLQDPHLQQVFLPEMLEENSRVLLLRAEPISGVPLTECFADKPASESETMQIISQAVQALGALHKAGLVHGLPNPERIFWDGKRAKLIIDPMAPELPLKLDVEMEHSILNPTLDSGTRLAFAAPEFVAPQQYATASTDVFCLAKTWAWLLGERDDPYSNLDDALAANASVRAGKHVDALDAPIRKVLLHGIAPDPQRRFSNANDLAIALQAAIDVVQKGRISVSSHEAPISPEKVKATVANEIAAVDPSEAVTDPTRLADTPATAASKVNEETAAKPKPSTNKRSGDQQVKELNTADKLPEKKAAKAKESVTRKTSPAVKAKESGSRGKDSARASAKEKSDSSQKETDVSAKASEERTSEPFTRPAASSKHDVGKPESGKAKATKPSVGEDAGGKQTQVAAVVGQVRKESKASPSTSAPASVAASPSSRKVTARGKRRRSSNKWMIPVVGGFGFLIVLLLALQFSGALDGMRREQSASKPKPAYVAPAVSKPKIIEKDPLLDYFNLVEDDQGLWAPLNPPAPPQLDLLPPGAGMFVWLRVDQILEEPRRLGGQSLWGGIDNFESWLTELTGVETNKIEDVIVGLYAPVREGGFPLAAVRVTLKEAAQKESFADMIGTSARWADENLLEVGAKQYYVRLTQDQLFSEYSAGPQSLMRDVAELQGGAGPLLRNVETLFAATSTKDDVFVVASAPFLIAEGRGMIEAVPARGQQVLKDMMGIEARAISFASSMSESWFFEMRIVGTANQEAAMFAGKLESGVRGLAERVESWFVDELPHPHWRALALRYPQMLRTFSTWTRIGVEDGVAVMNGYLPVEAADNLLLATSIALQDTATVNAGFSTGASGNQPSIKTLSTDEFLARRITLSFDQEPIEKALSMVAEEANSDLPAGTPAIEFRLDGDAFELAGLTRNFQLRDFQHRDAPVRDALTEIAKRGNQDQTVTDLASANQTLVWGIQTDASKTVILLTTRTAAEAGGSVLAREFVE